MRALSLIAALPILVAACLTSEEGDAPDHHRVLAYDTLDACAVHQAEDACVADGERCLWYAFGAPCQEGEPCVTGVCQDIDPCRAHGDAQSCGAATDDRCAWAESELCPADDCGDGGFCYQVPEDDCTCVCPLECDGADCPPCECDCSGGGGGEDNCVCTGTVCPDGATDCEADPIECTCDTDTGVVCPDAQDAEGCAAAEGCAWVASPCPLCPEPECGECEETYSCQYVGDDGSSGGGTGSGGTVPPWDQ
jgi:hypothetical protein